MQSDRKQAVEKILDRGVVVKMLPTRDAIVDRLAELRPARIYIGADPTGPDLHLSHAKNYMLLEELRLLGHQVIVLFGDFTAKIGDPSDRSSARARLTDDKVRHNIDRWRRQIEPIISFDDPVNPAQILLNSEWLSQLGSGDLLELASHMTVQQMLERSMFRRRLESQAPIHLHEFLYPLFQGYDSVAMEVDFELCGSDQEFNALVGRTLRSRMQNAEKGVIEVHLMENPVTEELMSKSNGTGVFLSGTAEDLFGQVMALPDEMVETCLISVTRIPLDEVRTVLSGHPRDAKVRLARSLVTTFHGPDSVVEAEKAFQVKFVDRRFPADAPTYSVEDFEQSALSVALLGGQDKFGSRSKVRRVVADGGLKVNGVKVQSPDDVVVVESGGVEVQLGKRLWFKVVCA